MEFPVGALEGLLDALDRLHDVQRGDQIHVHAAGISDQADDGVVLALGDVQPEAVALQPVGEVFHLVFIDLVLEQNNHGKAPFGVVRGRKRNGLAVSFTARPSSGFPLNPRYSKAPYLRVPIKVK